MYRDGNTVMLESVKERQLVHEVVDLLRDRVTNLSRVAAFHAIKHSSLAELLVIDCDNEDVHSYTSDHWANVVFSEHFA